MDNFIVLGSKGREIQYFITFNGDGLHFISCYRISREAASSGAVVLPRKNDCDDLKANSNLLVLFNTEFNMISLQNIYLICFNYLVKRASMSSVLLVSEISFKPNIYFLFIMLVLATRRSVQCTGLFLR